MEVQIDIPTAPTLRRQIEDIVRSAMARVAFGVRSVTVSVRDFPMRHMPNNKHCRFIVRLWNHTEIAVNSRGHDTEPAVVSASDRASREIYGVLRVLSRTPLLVQHS